MEEIKYTSIVEIDSDITALEDQYDANPTDALVREIYKLCKLANAIVGWRRYAV